MARIFMDGFEHGKPSPYGTEAEGDYFDGMWQQKLSGGYNWSPGQYYGGCGVSSSIKNGGAYSCRFWKGVSHASSSQDTYATTLYKNLGSNYNKLFSRFYLYIDSSNVSSTDIFSFFGFGSGSFYGNTSMQLRYDLISRTLYLYINGSQVASAASILLDTTWQLIEVLYDYSGSNIVVKVDNSEVIDYSGTIDNNINYVMVGKSDTRSVQGNEKFDFYIDDFALNDDSGSVNNSWIGAGVIRLIKPTSDDTNADFTPSTGSDHYALVDDFPDDGDTTYNSSTVSGDIDTFGLESVPSVETGQTINAVQAVYRARSETDVASVAPILISGATTDTGATQSTVLSDYNDTKQEIYDVDPNTSAQWTEANVNAVKGGYKNAT